MGPSIKDVAHMAGVSTSTVSLVFNQPHRIKEETRFRVLAVAEKLNYIPNRLARSLVTNKTRTIGLVISDIIDPFYAEISRAVEDTLGKEGYSLILCNTDNDIKKEEQYINLLLEQNVEGIILVPIGTRYEHLLKTINQGKKIVFVDRKIDKLPICSVTINNEKAGYIATKYLIDKGHKVIACISGNQFLKEIKDRIKGYKNALFENDLPLFEPLIVPGSYEIEENYNIVMELFKKKKGITGIFITDDIIAYVVLDSLKKLGINVPEQVSIVSCDDISFSKFLRVPLTTISQPKYELGQVAAKLILKKLNKVTNDDSIENIELPFSLVIRDSVANGRYKKRKGNLKK